MIAGFNPILVLFSEAVVQLYQTALHTETIGKLPRPVEAVLNTPSHHGSNPQYIDKNYGGIFIVWDRLFGTFEEEREQVVYGIVTPLDSVNPFVVFFHGLARLFRKVAAARGARAKLACLLRPPGWTPAAAEHRVGSGRQERVTSGPVGDPADRDERALTGSEERFYRRVAETEQRFTERLAATEQRFTERLVATEQHFTERLAATETVLRQEMHAGFVDVHKQIGEIHKQIGEVHKQITAQTRWLLVAVGAAAVLIPVVQRIVETVFPG